MAILSEGAAYVRCAHFCMKEFWMKRRILSLIFAALLLLPGRFSAAATVPVAITSEDVWGNVGGTVSVALNIAIEPPKLGQTMDSLQFVLTYDSSALEFVSIQEVSQDRIKILGVEYMCSIATSTGKVGFTASAVDGASGSGELMHVKFKVLSPVSTPLVLKNVAYSFVSKNGASQDRKQGGIINLGHVTGQSVPTTLAPASTAPAGIEGTPSPSGTGVPTDEPRFPVTEVTIAPGKEPTEEPEESDSDILAYIVFGLFIVVAILVCVVLTLMIVRRGKNRARTSYFEDDDEDELEPLMEPERTQPPRKRPAKAKVEEDAEDEDDEDEMPIQIVRRGKK